MKDPEIVKQALEHFTEETVVLDIGCNYTSISKLLDRSKMYVGIYNSADMTYSDIAEFALKDRTRLFSIELDHFIRTILPQLGTDTENVICLCKNSADLTPLARETFKLCFTSN